MSVESYNQALAETCHLIPMRDGTEYDRPGNQSSANENGKRCRERHDAEIPWKIEVVPNGSRLSCGMLKKTGY